MSLFSFLIKKKVARRFFCRSKATEPLRVPAQKVPEAHGAHLQGSIFKPHDPAPPLMVK